MHATVNIGNLNSAAFLAPWLPFLHQVLEFMLDTAKILVIGAGGLGCELLKDLVSIWLCKEMHVLLLFEYVLTLASIFYTCQCFLFFTRQLIFCIGLELWYSCYTICYLNECLVSFLYKCLIFYYCLTLQACFLNVQVALQVCKAVLFSFQMGVSKV